MEKGHFPTPNPHLDRPPRPQGSPERAFRDEAARAAAEQRQQ
eukprot:gene25794-62861_t